jgi:O-succinylbenzoic acid--CoA ligase
MLDWLRRQPPDRVFIEFDDTGFTYGQTVEAVEARPVAGVEVVRPWPYFSSVVDLLAVMSGGTAVVVAEDSSDLANLEAGDVASVIFTSGSSGGPKAVRLTANNWEAACRASAEHLGLGPGDVWLLAMPLHHVAGLSILLRSAYVGGTVRMLPGFDPSGFAAALHSGVTLASVVPTMLSRFLDVDPGPYRGLRAVLVGGGPIGDDLLIRAASAGLPVLPSYGMTEACGQVATLRPGSPLENKAHRLPGVELRIEPDGRIAVRGPMVSPGYVGQPDRRADEWFVTSDLGELQGDTLQITGRADTVIISGGENIYPATVEAAISRVAGVREALVVGLPSEEWGMEVACLYVGEANPTRIESHLRDRLPGFMVPKRWLRVEKLPLTAMGKPDRAEAARRFRQP